MYTAVVLSVGQVFKKRQENDRKLRDTVTSERVTEILLLE